MDSKIIQNGIGNLRIFIIPKVDIFDSLIPFMNPEIKIEMIGIGNRNTLGIMKNMRLWDYEISDFIPISDPNNSLF